MVHNIEHKKLAIAVATNCIAWVKTSASSWNLSRRASRPSNMLARNTAVGTLNNGTPRSLSQDRSGAPAPIPKSLATTSLLSQIDHETMCCTIIRRLAAAVAQRRTRMVIRVTCRRMGMPGMNKPMLSWQAAAPMCGGSSSSPKKRRSRAGPSL